jgi:hypothetical protein
MDFVLWGQIACYNFVEGMSIDSNATHILQNLVEVR